MTAHEETETSHAGRTAAAMHHTAAQLEVAEAILHRSAAQTPNPDTADRLDSLGEQVTAQAHDIDRRADRLAGPPGPDPAPHQRSLPGHKTTAPGNSDDSEVA